jgi:CheY-like chemotaxis protein/anti-sigma regulatory factor (Ser/Thr protein kinase)
MESKRIDFKYLFSSKIPEVLYGDKSIVRDIIINLLNNAIEYTKNGYVDFKVFCKNNEDTSSLVIIVEDSGVGISEENLDKMFEKFSKFDEEVDDLNVSGLELSLTKKLVDLLGGRIVVKTAEGAGTKFVVYLEQKIAHNQKALEEVKEEVLEEESKLDLTGKKILIVDDNNLNLKVAVNFIKPYGATISTCTSGSECISLINSGNVYDLIFMDYMMPNMSGADTLHALKEDPEFKQRVVVLTANNIEGFREHYIEAGFEDYIAKPIIREELERILRKYLNNNVQKVVYDDEKKD